MMNLRCLFFAVLVGNLTSCGGANFSGNSEGAAQQPPNATPPLQSQPPSPQPTTQPVPTTTPPPPSKSIEFGADKVFHIGDNNYEATTCRKQIQSYNLNGTRYYFTFEVLESQTTAAIRINTVCGVDYGKSNFVAFMKDDGTVLKRQPLPIGASSIDFGTLTLEKGKYAIVVESTVSSNGDADDFLVGNITVSADKNIVQGIVTAQ